MSKRPLFTAPTFNELCPKCGADLQLKTGKHGLFLGCNAYPMCDFVKPLQQTQSKILKVLDENCPSCGNALVLRQGQYGMFIGCSDYPQCNTVVHDQPRQIEESVDIACPSCQKGRLVGRRGRQGRLFYGCDQYPRCHFKLSDKPVVLSCPKCGFPLALKHGALHQCADRHCRHLFGAETI